VHSARAINFTTQQYEIDQTTGGFVGMPVVAQRVALLVSFEVEPTKFITPQENQKIRQRIYNALKVLTEAKPPIISITSVDIGSDSAGTSYRNIVYRNLLEGTDINQTVQLP
jgi:hypothetical protein